MYKLKSAKLIVFIYYAILSAIMIFTGKVSGAEYFDFSKWLIAFYFTANVASKFFKIKEKWQDFLNKRNANK